LIEPNVYTIKLFLTMNNTPHKEAWIPSRMPLEHSKKQGPWIVSGKKKLYMHT
jgi:hypothetical protein